MSKTRDRSGAGDVRPVPSRRHSARIAASDAESTSRKTGRRSAPSFNLDGAADEPDLKDHRPFVARASLGMTARRVLSGVSVPSMSVEKGSEASTLRRRADEVGESSPLAGSAGPRSPSESSWWTTRRGRSSGYDTPGTSNLVTPAEPVTHGPSVLAADETAISRPRIDAVVRAAELERSRYAIAPPRGKRRWDSESEDEVQESADATLARALQETEFTQGMRSGSGVSPSTTRARARAKKPRYPPESSVGSDDIMFNRSGVPRAPHRTSQISDRHTSSSGRRETRSSAKVVAAKDGAKSSVSGMGSSRFAIEDSEGTSSGLSSIDSDEYLTDQELEPEEDGETTVPKRQVPPTAAARLSRFTRVPPAASSSRLPIRRAAAQATTRLSARRRRAGEVPAGVASTRAETERAKLVRHHDDVLNMWDRLAATPVIRTAKVAQPKSITRELKSFQLEGLNWMIKQEKTKWRGGLLGDEMGMGKTIQAVSLIMSDFPAKSPTLIIVPPVALMQWQNEIRDYTCGKLKVLVYHGTAVKKLSMKELKAYDVLMTSYHTLEFTYRKQQKGWTRKDKEDDDAKVLIKEDSPFHAIQFHRVILDEAHSIKSRQTATAKACFALKADYKWCLSGTPLQNRIGELFSLLRFLEVRPFACYMCKSCPCTQLQWTLDPDTRLCTTCRHRGFDHVSLFNLELLNPISEHGNNGPGREAFGKLRVLMDRIMLRRVKADHASSMDLPGKDVNIHNEFFGDVECDFASSIMSNTTRQFDTYVAQGVMLNNYANIFGLIMQMRQVADHPDMILRKDGQGGQNVLVCCICDDPAEDAIRSVCHHDFCRACVKAYVNSFTESVNEADCPRCHIPLAIDLEQEEREQDEQAVRKSSIINRIQMDKWTSSTKIETLVYELALMRSQKRTAKTIVFSQFTSMLQLVEWRLRRTGFNTVMLDGTMTPTQRQSSIDYFMKSSDVEVFLVSLKAGGVALNLTEASKVYLVDPWWNPAAEWQSADRCHRIGQGRSCAINRLVIEDSVESRMVLLQEKKSNMIRGTINADETAMQNLTPEDMQFLFRGS